MAEIKDKLVTVESLKFIHGSLSEKIGSVNTDLADKTDTINALVNNAQNTADAAVIAANNAQSTADKKISMKTTVVTLLSTDWVDNTQTVVVDGVTADNTVIPGPDPASLSTYAENGVYCCAQGVSFLVFACDYTPSEDILVNIVLFAKEVGNDN